MIWLWLFWFWWSHELRYIIDNDHHHEESNWIELNRFAMNNWKKRNSIQALFVSSFFWFLCWMTRMTNRQWSMQWWWLPGDSHHSIVFLQCLSFMEKVWCKHPVTLLIVNHDSWIEWKGKVFIFSCFGEWIIFLVNIFYWFIRRKSISFSNFLGQLDHHSIISQQSSAITGGKN